ncbi:MAG: hypothetical protein HKN29_08295, partial [Rhodothermales bacterium]|nr:hypothetical protein [Rhodothermales bacterium]
PRPLIFLLLAAIVAGCASETDTRDPEDVSRPEPDPPTQAQLDARSQYLSGEQLEVVAAFEARFHAIDSQEALADVFEQATVLGDSVLPPDNAVDFEVMEQFQSFPGADLGIAGLEASCVAECTVSVFAPDLEAWRNAAAFTAGDEDDAFIELVADNYGYPFFSDGRVTGWGSYFERTWDYGGYSLLGSGTHRDLLGRIDSLSAGSNHFDGYLSEMRNALMDDAAGWRGCYGADTPEVETELRDMLELTSLTPEDRNAINARLAALAAGDAAVETGCRDLACSCSSG